jgi:beta-fructofuranosidase
MQSKTLMNIDRRDFFVRLMGASALSTVNKYAFVTAAQNSGDPKRLATDPRRPQFHFVAPANWMNDPNGPVYWNGIYHMFYQHNPNAAVWGDMHWGHAISRDMIHWRHMPIALAPTPGGADADGCFSGTAIVQNGQVQLMYTGVRAVNEVDATIKGGAQSYLETQCLAIANDPDLRTWSKLLDPVIAAPPQDLEVNGFRDPSPWRQGDWWYTVLGSGIANQGGAVLLYRSKDLRSWEYMHILAKREGTTSGNPDPFDTREVWECPEFFPMKDRHVLIYSASGKVWWKSGKLDQERMAYYPDQGAF